MDTNPNVGDIVALNSGGPPMTVERVTPDQHSASYFAVCAWMNGGVIKAVSRDSFPVACLKPYPVPVENDVKE